MLSNDDKAKRSAFAGVLAPIRKVKDLFAHRQEKRDVTVEYIDKLLSIGRPFECSIKLEKRETPPRYNRLGVLECKRSISYLAANDVVGYKTLTHVLKNGDSEMFGISVSSDGTLEFYNMVADSKKDCDAIPIGKVKISDRIIDPLAAFVNNDELTLVFNLPTAQTIREGVEARKPIFSDDRTMAVACGAPIAVTLTKEKEIKVSLRNLPNSALPKYAVWLLDVPNESKPRLLVANILVQVVEATEEEREALRPGFSDFFASAFGVSEANTAFSVIPFGVSTVKLDGKSEYVSVPISGSSELGIRGVVLNAIDDTESSTVQVVVCENDINDSSSESDDTASSEATEGSVTRPLTGLEDKTAVMPAIDSEGR